MHTLTELCENSFPEGHVVALSGEEEMTWGRFLADVSVTAGSLGCVSGDPWALYERDSYRFAVGLFALLGRGCKVYLPGENHPGVVAALASEGASLLGEFAGQSCQQVCTAGGDQKPYPGPLTLTGKIVVYTSGSTGEPKAIEKPLQQLEAEISVLEQVCGPSLGKECAVLGTVSHQHLYGLLFSILWPMCAGRRFWRRPFVDPLLLARQTLELGAVAWVMSPAHLQRLSQDMPWQQLRPLVRSVFSSGGPLRAAAAAEVAGGLGHYPCEVLGSSETGGIAIRRQETEGEPWQALPTVEIAVSAEGALRVRSPFLANNDWYQSADQAQLLEDGRFQLGPRLDRIVKIEGKRVSLPEIELALAGHRWIQEAHALALQNQRQYVGTVIALTADGSDALQALGLRGFNQSLRAHLSGQLVTVAIPRQWRLVPRLPRNDQGKLVREKLKALFDLPRPPDVLAEKAIPGGVELRVYVDHGNRYFEGHFPETPVLPGVVQIMWAERLARDYLALSGEFEGMRAVKFKQIVQPGCVLTVSLTHDTVRGELGFTFSSPQAVHSQGRMVYRSCN